MKRVLFGYILNGKAGGIDKYMLEFADRFSPDEVRFDFLTNHIDPDLQAKLEKMGAGLYEVPSLKHPSAQYRAVRALAAQNRYDTAYFNISTAMMWPGIKAAHDAVIPKVIIHSHSSDCGGEGLSHAVYRLFHRLCRPFLHRYGTDFYACSMLAGEWLFPQKVIKSPSFRLVKNAIDVSRYAYSPAVRETTRRDLGLEGRFVLGTVGNMQYPKNPLFTLNVFAHLASENPDALLLMVGDGPLMEDVRQKAASLGLADRVLLPGRQPNVPDYLQAMDVYLMPSHFEGFSIAALEAQAAGLPCFLSQNITAEMVLTDTCYRLSVDRPGDAAAWAAAIAAVKGYERRDGSPVLVENGYSLADQSVEVLI